MRWRFISALQAAKINTWSNYSVLQRMASTDGELLAHTPRRKQRRSGQPNCGIVRIDAPWGSRHSSRGLSSSVNLALLASFTRVFLQTQSGVRQIQIVLQL